MSVYVQVLDALRGIAGDRVFPVIAPANVEVPYIIVQRAGGVREEFLSGEVPEKKRRRIQVTVWAGTALEAEAVGDQVEQALLSAKSLQPEAIGDAVDDYDELTTYRGCRQEFYLFC